MVPVSLNGLKGNEGWILAEPIRNSMGSLLCPAEKLLDENTVELLKKYFMKSDQQLNKVTIQVKFNSETLTKEQKEIMQTMKEQNCDVPSFLDSKLQANTLFALKNAYITSEKNMENTLTVINQCVDSLTACIQNESDFSYSLGQYKTADVFEHSLRVAQFSVALANIYNQTLKTREGSINLKTIGTAALLHDYGVCFKEKDGMKKLSLHQLGENFLNTYSNVPNNLLQLPYDETYRTVYAYSALKNLLDNSTLMMILLSNESENGKTGLHTINDKADAITMGAKIIFLCNLYDSLLFNTIEDNQSLENVSSLLEYLAKNGAINKNLTKLFIDNIPLYSVGVRVLLSTGEYATVVERFKGKDACRPVVKTLVNPPLVSKIVDLREKTNVTISQIVGSTELLDEKIREITNLQLKTLDITSIPASSYDNSLLEFNTSYVEQENKKKI